jgi:GR25 family glycosyltransferase involved in LPS biosynthesis
MRVAATLVAAAVAAATAAAVAAAPVVLPAHGRGELPRLPGWAPGARAAQRALAATSAAKAGVSAVGEWPATMATTKLFVVTLARNSDRWEYFLKGGDTAAQFPGLTRFEAVDGRSLNLLNDSRLSLSARVAIMRGTRRDHTDINTPGMVGCYLSHLALWQRVADERLPLAVVMEDDANVQPGLAASVDALLARLPNGDDWDVLLLGYAHPPTEAPSGRFPGFGDVSYWHGTIAYVVTARGAARLLAYATPVQFQVDGYMAFMAKLGRLTVLHDGGAVNVRSVWGTGTTVQDRCHLCDLPHDYKRMPDVLWWVALGAVLAVAANFAWDRGLLKAVALWLAPVVRSTALGRACCGCCLRRLLLLPATAGGGGAVAAAAAAAVASLGVLRSDSGISHDSGAEPTLLPATASSSSSLGAPPALPATERIISGGAGLTVLGTVGTAAGDGRHDVSDGGSLGGIDEDDEDDDNHDAGTGLRRGTPMPP